ncbi:uncharacterized protein LOC116351259 [Contarinia nasturtii]|uniref:uncharacterized protein LOC116351259 n=1 Tax=Contarinia nasturtii TaxID=265458 RepID=UPI0012D461FA|nr:uncharacterized protein LOC116351259 [Contarinia nasturtii]
MLLFYYLDKLSRIFFKYKQLYISLITAVIFILPTIYGNLTFIRQKSIELPKLPSPANGNFPFTGKKIRRRQKPGAPPLTFQRNKDIVREIIHLFYIKCSTPKIVDDEKLQICELNHKKDTAETCGIDFSHLKLKKPRITFDVDEDRSNDFAEVVAKDGGDNVDELINEDVEEDNSIYVDV